MILTVTVNPSLDTLYQMEQYTQNTVNRVQRVTVTAGGKGLNTARVAAALGEKVTAAGIVGGYNGKKFISLLPQEIGSAFTFAPGETRCCINVHDAATGRHTELLESGAAVSQSTLTEFYGSFALLLRACDLVTLNGSLLPGCPQDFYAALIKMAHSAGKPVLLDSSGAGLQEGVKARPTLIKPNADEIAQLTGEPVQNLPQIMRAAHRLHETGIPWVVISLGKNGAAVVCDEGSFRATTPDIPVVNTVGCGDSMMAGFAVGIVRGADAATCIRMGMAAATANALSASTGSIVVGDYERLLPQIKVEIYGKSNACPSQNGLSRQIEL